MLQLKIALVLLLAVTSAVAQDPVLHRRAYNQADDGGRH